MAVTSNSYTGNGSTTQYSITFQYIATTDIKAQINGVATTAFSLANATTLQFNSAPANGAAVIIYRETDDTNIPATFFAGSSIRSQDLNDNFTQTLYIGQETAARAVSTLGSTMNGDLTLGQNSKVLFEGSTADAHETTLTVTNPTADRTITLPNVTGTVVTTGDSGTVTSTMIADGTIAAADLASNSVTTAKIVDANVTTAKIADSQITSAKIADGTIVAGDLASDSVTTAKVTDANITTSKIADSNVTTAKIADNAITNAKMADNSVNSAEIAANAVTASELADNAVDTAAIADNAVTSAKIVANAVTSSELADNAVDTAAITNAAITSAKIANSSITNSQLTTNCIATSNIADNAITAAKINANAVDTSEIKDDAVTVAKIADAELSTLAGMQSGTASVLASSTALTSTTAELNQLDGKTVTSSFNGGNSNDIPTSSAINSHFISLIDSLGGFVAISNEVSFPNTNPDPSDNAGTVVSIQDAGGVVINGSGVSTTGRTLGASTVTINGFPSSLHSKTLAAGLGLQVQTTSTLNTYTYHKLIAKEADVEQLSTDINDFAARYRVGSSNPTTDLDNGDLFFNTGTGKMLVYNSNNTAWEEVQSVGNFFINTISSYSGTGGNSATFNGSAYRFVLSNAPTNAEQLLVSINGVVQKPTAGTSQPAEGFSIDGSSIIFSSAPPSGSDWFIITIGSTVNIGTPSNNTVTEAILQNNQVSEEKLKIGNTPTNGKYLQAQSGQSGGLFWADVGGASSISLNDDVPLWLGTDDNFAFRHFANASGNTGWVGGSANTIYTSSGTSGVEIPIAFYHLKTESGNAVWHPELILNPEGSVDIYHNAVKKLATSATGITVTGTVVATSFTGDGSNLTGITSIGGATGVDFNDNVKARFGTGNDLEIYHTSTNSLIKHEGAGDLYIDSYNKDVYIRAGDGNTSVENAISCINNAQVELYYSGSKKLATDSFGVSIQGDCLKVPDGSAASPGFTFNNEGSADTGIFRPGANTLAFSTDGTEAFRIRENGTITSNHGGNSITYGGFPQPNFFGKSFTSHTHAGLQLEANGNDTLGGISQHDDHLALHNSYRNAGGYVPLQCHIGGVNRMTIATNGVISGDFNDTSDANLKENVASIPDGSLAIIKQLRPVTFDWKNLGKEVDTNHDSITGPSNVSGFLAQEVKPLIPSVVEGTEWDESKPDGDRYSINTNGLVAHLTKALQEAITEIETLKTKVAALEAK